MVEEGEPKPDESSKYNEASLQIIRLNNLWIKAEEYSNDGNLEKWTYMLDSIFRELRADINHLKESKEDGNNYSEQENTIRENQKLKLKVLIARSKNRTEWYKALNKRHEFLKQLQDNVGKGGIFEDGRDKDYE